MIKICTSYIKYLFLVSFLIILVCEICISFELPKLITILDLIYNYKMNMVKLSNCMATYIAFIDNINYSTLPGLSTFKQCYISGYNNVTQFTYPNKLYLNINYNELTNSLETFLPSVLPIEDVLNGTYSIQEITTKQNQLNMTTPQQLITEIEIILTYVKNTLIITHYFQYFFIGILFMLLFVYQFLMNKQLLQINNHTTEKLVLNQLCHEMRTSLVPVEMYTRELLVKINDDDIKHFVMYSILPSIKQHLYVLKSRLDFDKIMSNNYTLRNENIDLLSYTYTILKEIKQYIQLSDKIIKTNIDCDKDTILVNIDVVIMRYIYLNILRNSVKHCNNDDSINITLSINDNIIIITISDTGEGITKKKLQLLNTKNIRKPSLTNEDSYGLGINFVKKLINFLPDSTFTMYSRGINMGTKSVITFKFENTIIELNNIHISNVSYRICITDDCILVKKCMERTINKLFEEKFKINLFTNGEDLLRYNFLKKYEERYIHIIDENMEASGGVLKGSEVALKLKNNIITNDEHHTIISMSGNSIPNKYTNYFDQLWEKPPPSNDIIKSNILSCCKTSIDSMDSLKYINVV